jgi:hypothetical protein
MSIVKTLAAAIALALPAAALSQGVISMSGLMTVQEGGSGHIRGLVSDKPAAGTFFAAFDKGALAQVRSTSILSVSIPGVTAFFSGRAVVVINGPGGPREVRARYLVMVDDLAGTQYPDQFLIRVDTSGGQTYIRHGRLTRGDISVSVP